MKNIDDMQKEAYKQQIENLREKLCSKSAELEELQKKITNYECFIYILVCIILFLAYHLF